MLETEKRAKFEIRQRNENAVTVLDFFYIAKFYPELRDKYNNAS